MSQIHGQATIRIDGQVFESEDDATLKIGGKKNTGRMIGQKFNHSQTVIPSEITCKVPVTSELDVKTLQEATGVEVTFESDVGKTYIIRDAVQENELSFQGGDGNGTVELMFKGAPAEVMS